MLTVKKMFKGLFVSAALLILTGCAMTQTEIPINYTPPSVPVDAKLTTQAISIQVNDFRDVRESADGDTKMIQHKTNGYGFKTSGAYMAQEPVALVVQKGFQEGLMQLGYKVNGDSPQFLLEGMLQSMHFDFLQGWASVTVKANMNVYLKLVNAQTKQVVWEDLVAGHVDDYSYMAITDEMIKGVLTKLLNQAINELETSQAFYDAAHSKPAN